MNILCLLLAQALTGHAFTQPADIYGQRTDFYINMPARDPLLDYDQRLIESSRMGHAVQTGQVYDPFSGREMIRTTAPASPYYNMTREQASKIREVETENLKNEVNIRNAELKQKADAMDYKYRLSQIDQSEKYLDSARSLDPNHPDYLTHRAELDSKFPIGAQNPDVNRRMALLDDTYGNLQKSKEQISRSAMEKDAAEASALHKQEISQGRTMMFKYGPEALAQYEDLLGKDPSGSPLAVAARMVDAQEKESRVSQLRELGLDDNRISQFYTQGVNGQKTLDTRRVDSFIKTYPTASQAATSANALQKIMESQAGVAPEEWDPSVKAAYDFHGQQLQRYQSLVGQKPSASPQPKSAASWFGK